MTPLALLLLAAAPAAQDPAAVAGPGEPLELPRLPAPLAWLVDQDDYPLVSRDLKVLNAGADATELALDRLLYSFDAADHQAVAWCGELLYVNGPRPRSRPHPNVQMPLSVLRRGDADWQAVGRWQEGATPTRFAPAPDGAGVLLHSFQSVGFLPPGETRADAVQWLLTPEQGLGSAQIRQAVWTADGSAVYVSIKRYRDDGPEDGLWRLDVQRRDDGSIDGFADAVRVDAARGTPRAGWPGGGLLATRKNGRDFYAVRSLLLVRPGTDHAPQALLDDLHWNESFAVEPVLLGRADRPTGPPRIAYVRAIADERTPSGTHGAIVLRGTALDGTVVEREIWSGAREADGLAWSPDGRWLAFHARDAERKPWVWALELESGTAHRLGPGLRPAWGPLSPVSATPPD